MLGRSGLSKDVELPLGNHVIAMRVSLLAAFVPKRKAIRTMRKKLVAAALMTGIVGTLVSGVPAASAATSADAKLRCVTHTTWVKGNTRYLKVRNGCARTVKVNLIQTGPDSGYKPINVGKTRTWEGGSARKPCGLRVYYKGTRYYNKLWDPKWGIC